MIIPDRLDDWTYTTVAGIVQSYTYKPEWFDYKEVLTPIKGEAYDYHRKSICRTACSMANAGGGYLLFGVQDAKARAATPIARSDADRAHRRHPNWRPPQGTGGQAERYSARHPL